MAKAKHGKTATPEHKSWSGMKDRCLNPSNPAYHKYGGRGITVHESWVNDFMAFYNHIGPRPSPEYSVDRIDNDGNYEPGNVRWATPKEQANNRSTNRQVEMPDGRLISTEQAAIELNMSPKTLMTRLHKGTPLDIPIRIERSGVEYKGKHMTWEQLSTLYGVDKATIMKRTHIGMDVQEAISRPLQETVRYPYEGQYLTIPEVANRENLDPGRIRYHLKNTSFNNDIGAIVKFIKRNYVNGVSLGTNFTHGKTKSAEYRAWCAMKSKCYNSKDSDYRTWGAIGAHICEEWRNDFTKFASYMGDRPSKKHCLNVPDKSKPAGPGNCCWAIYDFSSRQVNYKLLKLSDGREVDINEAVKITGLCKDSIYNRANKGIPIDQKPEINYIKYPYMDKFLNIHELAAIRGFKIKTVQERIRLGHDAI